MKKLSFFKNKRAEVQKAKEQWESNLLVMYGCIVDVCGKEKAEEVAKLMEKRVKIL